MSGKEKTRPIPAPPKKIHLELTEREALALIALLERWPSRPLAATTGHSRNTLRAWFLRVAWQVKRQARIEQSQAHPGAEGGTLA